MMRCRTTSREVAALAKNPKKTKEAEVLDEKAVRELEELKQRLRAETSADMVVLRALMDAERQARGIEQAASNTRSSVAITPWAPSGASPRPRGR